MTVTLSPETQQLIADQMARHGYSTADEWVRDVLERIDDGAPVGVNDDLGLDPDVLADIARSEGESDRGETYSWAEVEAEIKAKHNIA